VINIRIIGRYWGYTQLTWLPVPGSSPFRWMELPPLALLDVVVWIEFMEDRLLDIAARHPQPFAKSRCPSVVNVIWPIRRPNHGYLI